jgi:hypothetical protein
MAAPTGMVFNIDASGNPQTTFFNDTGAAAQGNAETAYPGDMQLVVTGVPAGTSPATIAASILSSPIAIPLGWKTKHWQIAYSSLGSANTATAW